MKKLILLLVLSMFSFSATAQVGGYTMIGRWTCADVLDNTEEEYNILTWWTHGFLAAKGDEHHNDPEKEVAFTAKILELCQLQPSITIYDATKATFMWGGYE
jgi:uncharacterized sporulation protein YeaH/YhbH (DUF444 family)